MIVHPPEKLVIKAGTSVLTNLDGKPNLSVMRNLIKEMADLKRKKMKKLLYVSSGAKGFGTHLYETLGQSLKDENDQERFDQDTKDQVWTMLGQPLLMHEYIKLLEPDGMFAAMGLLERRHFEDENSSRNMNSPIHLAFNDPNVLPIFNENDLTAVQELRFTDNDHLTSYLASFLKVDTAIFLTGSTDGLKNKNGHLIPEVHPDEFDLSELSFDGKNPGGKGGMESKFRVSMELARMNIQVFIARGTRENVIQSLIGGDSKLPHTYFHPLPLKRAE